MIKKEIGRLLFETRISQGITQAQLAEMTGFTIRAISYWENGKRALHGVNAEKVFDALGYEMELVLKRKE